jgi:hypothetical protein
MASITVRAAANGTRALDPTLFMIQRRLARRHMRRSEDALSFRDTE